MLRRFVIRWLINSIAIYAAIKFIDGLSPDNDTILAYASIGLIFGLVNLLIKPILKIITFPLLILTLGLFSIVINLIIFYLVGFLGSFFGFGYNIDTVVAALLGVLIMVLVNFVLGMVFKSELKD